MNTKQWLLCAGLMIQSGSCASAQVVPTTPRKFTTRDIGGSSTAGVSVTPPPKQEPMVRTTTYIVLAPLRQWTNSDGKPLMAKLIAFEEITVQTTKAEALGNTKPEPPKLNGKPTVVRDGKVRLMADNKPYEVAVDKLSPADQEFINTMKRAIAATK